MEKGLLEKIKFWKLIHEVWRKVFGKMRKVLGCWRKIQRSIDPHQLEQVWKSSKFANKIPMILKRKGCQKPGCHTCSNLSLDRNSFGIFWWTKIVWIGLKLGKIITLDICDLLEFSGIYLRIFPIKIFQKLETDRKSFGRFCPIFWTWPCVETHIYGKYMSTEFP